MRRRSEHCPSALGLDEWLAGELTPEGAAQVEAHVADCRFCQSRRAERLETRRTFAADAPSFAALVSRGSEAFASAPPGRSARRRRWRWVAGASALAAAAALALLVGAPWPAGERFGDVGAGSGTRTKGNPASLGWVVRRGARVFAPGPDERLRAGDALRFTVSAREPVFVAIFGLDSLGRLSVYHPDTDQLSQVGPGKDQPLPTAIALDATPGDERLYGVFCRGSRSLSELRRAIERAPDAPLFPAGCTHELRTLSKETPSKETP
jgi:hypothetical protein